MGIADWVVSKVTLLCMLLDILFSIEGGPVRALLLFWWSHSEVSRGKSVLTTKLGLKEVRTSTHYYA